MVVMRDVHDDHEREVRLLIEDVNVRVSTAGLSRMRLRPSTVVAFKVSHVATPATQLSVKPWLGSPAAQQNQTKTQILHLEKTVQSVGKRETLISPVWTPHRSSSLAQRVQSALCRGKHTSRTVQRAGCVCIF